MSQRSDVFISYSRKDADFVRKLSDALKVRNLETWVDWEDIEPTTTWWQEICQGIEAANSFVFVISFDSIASPYPQKNRALADFSLTQHHGSSRDDATQYGAAAYLAQWFRGLFLGWGSVVRYLDGAVRC